VRKIKNANQTNNYDTIIIGGGQAGLATGYYLQQQERDFVILDGSERIGDAWRARWDSLRLFSPAKLDGLPGMPFPAAPDYYPHKDEVANYLAAYAERFQLPVESGVWVNRLARDGQRFVVETSQGRYAADNVVVAMAPYQVPWRPPFADELDSNIVQMHSADYRNLDQLQEGPVLIVGAGNSGAEIGLEVAARHRTWMSGRHVGHIPFRIEGRLAQWLLIPFVMRFLFHRVMTVDTPIGRKKRPEMLGNAGPLVRVKPDDLEAAGIQRLAKIKGVQDGRPVTEDGQELEVANVIWCTGFKPNFSWIDLPIFGGKENPKEPVHERGIVSSEPGLYFVGLFFLYALSSSLLTGVGRDAKYIAEAIAARSDVPQARSAQLSPSTERKAAIEAE
jgi:putative flavoprotein involved in K+ transport